MEEIEFGQYIESPIFEVEGYKWQMLVYPKGRDEEYNNSIAMYAYQVPGFTAGQLNSNRSLLKICMRLKYFR